MGGAEYLVEFEKRWGEMGAFARGRGRRALGRRVGEDAEGAYKRLRHGRGGSAVDGPPRQAQRKRGSWEEMLWGPEGWSLEVNCLMGGAHESAEREGLRGCVRNGRSFEGGTNDGGGAF